MIKFLVNSWHPDVPQEICRRCWAEDMLFVLADICLFTDKEIRKYSKSAIERGERDRGIRGKIQGY